MKTRTLFFVALLLLAASTLSAQLPHDVITCEQYAFTGRPTGVTSLDGHGYASGGMIYVWRVPTPGNENSYWTAGPFYPLGSNYTCSGCAHRLRVDFDGPASDIQFVIMNGLPRGEPTVPYVVRNDRGEAYQFSLPSYYDSLSEASQKRTIRLPFLPSLWIEFDAPTNVYNDSGGFARHYWNYMIDEVTFAPDPIYRQKISVQDLTNGDRHMEFALTGTEVPVARMPAGSKFEISMYKEVQPGVLNSVASHFALGSQTLAGDIHSRSLFPNHAVFEYDRNATGHQKLFQSVHQGEVLLSIAPENDDSIHPVQLKLVIEEPSSLGDGGNNTGPGGARNETGFDGRISDYANRHGFPPQLVKAIIFQETFPRWNIETWRYEPFTDLRHVATRRSMLDYVLAAPPRDEGGWPDGANLCRADSNRHSLACAFSDLDDISPRNVLEIRPDCNAGDRLIGDTDVFVTVRDIIEGTTNAGWGTTPTCGMITPTNPRPGRVRPVPHPDPWNYTAQTQLNSSYGLMQVVWQTAREAGWKGPQDRRNPALLFDLPQNLAANRDAGSIPTGTLVLQEKFRFRYDVGAVRIDTDPDFPNEAAFLERMRGTAERYNGQNDAAIEYSKLVMGYTSSFPPRRRQQIFSATSCAPIVAASAAGTTIERGTNAYLDARLTSGTAATYKWYAGSVGNRSQLLRDSLSPTLVVSPNSASTYWVEILNTCGKTATQSFSVNVAPACNAPNITVQPQPQTVIAGTRFQLSVGVSGGSVTWHEVPDVPLAASVDDRNTGSGAVQATSVGGGATVELDAPAQTTRYQAVVSNGCGSTASDVVTITVVCVPVKINGQPASQTITEGDTVTLTVDAEGSLRSQQWYIGDTNNTSQPIDGATGTSIDVHPTTTTKYWVRVTNACGGESSATTTITVVPPCDAAKITGEPQGSTIDRGETAHLAVATSGTAPLAYQWYIGNTGDTNSPIDGATAANYDPAPAQTTTYWLRVTNSCGSDDSDPATVTVVCTTPVIDQHPASKSIVDGDTTTLSVTAHGTEPLSYQWYAGTTLLQGETGRELIVTPETTTTYKVVITNPCGTDTSNEATVTVLQRCFRPIISGHPESKSITAGESAELSVTSGGTDPKSYAWYANGLLIPNANAASYLATPAVTTSYHVVITNDCGTATSDPATITVTAACEPPVIDVDPQSVPVSGGQSATLRVTARGTSLAYQWYANGSKIDGANGSTYTVTAEETTTYHVVVSNACGTLPSNPATITVTCQKPVLGLQPQSRAIETGDSVTLQVTSSGQQPFHYQWYANGSPIGFNSSSLDVTPPQTTDYWVVISNLCGSTTSNVATITVASCLPAKITQGAANATIAPGETRTLSVQASGTTPLSYVWRDGEGNVIGTGTSVNVSPAATTTYSVRVSNACGDDTDTATITVVDCPLPAISVHPKSFEIWEGHSAFYEVVATSSTPLSYQWYANGVAMPGVTSRALEIEPTVTTSYFVDVTNSCGTVRSNVGTVTVKPCTKPHFTTHPKSVTITEGESATLAGVASGTATITYTLIDQDRNFIDSNTTGVFSVRPPVQPGMSWDYWIIAANGCGSEFSNFAAVTVLPACTSPSITSQPSGTTIEAGGAATLSIGASGSTPLTIEWFTSGGAQVGSGSSIDVSPANTTSYYARVSNACGEKTSVTVTVTVTQPCTAPTVTSPASDTTLIMQVGDTRTLTVNAEGTNLQYQWYKSYPIGSTFVLISGQTLPTMNVSPEVRTDYRLRISNDCGVINSPLFKVVIWDGTGDFPGPIDPTP